MRDATHNAAVVHAHPQVKKENKREGEKCHGRRVSIFFLFGMAARMTEESIKKALAASSEPGKCGEMILSLLRSATAGHTQSVRLCEGG